MEFKFTEEQEKLRQKVRSFLEDEIKKGLWQPEVDAVRHTINREFSRRAAAAGLVGVNWPKKYGGQGLNYTDRLIVTEEMLRYGAPMAAHWMGERQVGPCLLKFGTEEQRQEFLPRMARAEISFGLGFSEPNAGTDLAAVQTSAVKDGDYYIINGQKTWTSRAHDADYIWMLVRTDPHAPRKHQGLSQFMLATNLPGITVNRIADMSGTDAMSEVFFDNVRVHEKYRVGPENQGWYQIVANLDYERGGPDRLMGNDIILPMLVEYARETKRNGKPLIDDPEIRNKLAQLKIEYEVGRMLIYRNHWLYDKGVVPNYEAALSKCYSCEYEQRLANTVMQILGPYGLLRADSKYVPLRGNALSTYMYCQAYTLQGGSSTTLRSIIAMRGFGLPRS